MKNYPFQFDHGDKTPLFIQISRSIIKAIEKGDFEKNDMLPSINKFSTTYEVARDTIERAYKETISQGYIMSVKGRGYYVQGKKEDQRLKVLLIFNNLSSHKKIVYYSLLNTLGDKAKVDLQIHHYNVNILKEIIEANLGKYHYYLVMPHFPHDADAALCRDVISLIPENELLLLDKDVEELEGDVRSITQDFKTDIYGALESARDLMDKYKRVAIVFPDVENQPLEIVEGVKAFCDTQNKKVEVLNGLKGVSVKKGTAYIVLEETDLGKLIKMVKQSDFEMGKDVGILSFNETIFKELLGITVVTTDFEAMGRIAANMLLKNVVRRMKNKFTMIRRDSL